MTFGFFCFFPLYSYVCILSRDNLVYYQQLLQSRLLCLFYTENMFLLKEMRKNLKHKICAIIEKFGPEMFEDFDKARVVKPKEGGLKRVNSNLADQLIAGRPISYYHEIELNNVFESIKISSEDINNMMEGLDQDLRF